MVYATSLPAANRDWLAATLKVFDPKHMHTLEQWARWLTLQVVPTFEKSESSKVSIYVRSDNLERVTHVLTPTVVCTYFMDVGAGLKRKPRSTKGRKRWRKERTQGRPVRWLLRPGVDLNDLFNAILVLLA
jgi:hypothetical protein